MLTREQNELLTQTGPATPMGQLFRRYWILALLSEELPQPDCDPIHVRLLGEDLVAVRGQAAQIRRSLTHERQPPIGEVWGNLDADVRQ